MVREFAKVMIFITFFQRYRDMNHIDSCPVTVATYKVLIFMDHRKFTRGHAKHFFTFVMMKNKLNNNKNSKNLT
jgi:hypothetical protein